MINKISRDNTKKAEGDPSGAAGMYSITPSAAGGINRFALAFISSAALKRYVFASVVMENPNRLSFEITPIDNQRVSDSKNLRLLQPGLEFWAKIQVLISFAVVFEMYEIDEKDRSEQNGFFPEFNSLGEVDAEIVCICYGLFYQTAPLFNYFPQFLLAVFN